MQNKRKSIKAASDWDAHKQDGWVNYPWDPLETDWQWKLLLWLACRVSIVTSFMTIFALVISLWRRRPANSDRIGAECLAVMVRRAGINYSPASISLKSTSSIERMENADVCPGVGEEYFSMLDIFFNVDTWGYHGCSQLWFLSNKRINVVT